MTVFELINFLLDCPPMNEVYVQTSETYLQKIRIGVVDRNGFVELKWGDKKDNGLITTHWILEEKK